MFNAVNDFNNIAIATAPCLNQSIKCDYESNIKQRFLASDVRISFFFLYRRHDRQNRSGRATEKKPLVFWFVAISFRKFFHWNTSHVSLTAHAIPIFFFRLRFPAIFIFHLFFHWILAHISSIHPPLLWNVWDGKKKTKYTCSFRLFQILYVSLSLFFFCALLLLTVFFSLSLELLLHFSRCGK